MYLALFLTPWLVIYAGSGLVLNHFQVVRGVYGDRLTRFDLVEERDYDVAFSADADARTIGARILDDLELAGSFNVQGTAGDARLVINRNGALAVHRITFFRDQHRLRIERLQLAAPAFFNRAHFRHGYEQPFFTSVTWAVMVDLVIVAMLFWVLSGIWMWWEIKPSRVWGAFFALAGLGVFALLVATI